MPVYLVSSIGFIMSATKNFAIPCDFCIPKVPMSNIWKL